MRLLEVVPQTSVVIEGEIGDAYYIILDGRCRITIRGATVTELGPGKDLLCVISGGHMLPH